MKRWLIHRIVPSVGYWLIRFLGWTTALQFQGYDMVRTLRSQYGGLIFAFWHSHQLLMPLVFHEKPACVLISQHRDGELICGIIQRFGHSAIRGSTTRGGGLAFRQLIRAGRTGGDLVVTPDGPKGPREVVKLGVIHLAKMTGLPIVPLVFACSKKKSFQAGTGLSFPIHLAKAFLCGGSLSGLTGRLMT